MSSSSEPLGQFLPKFALNIILLGWGGGVGGGGMEKRLLGKNEKTVG